MQRLEVSGAVRPIYGSLGVKRLKVLIGSKTRSYKLHFNLAVFNPINAELNPICHLLALLEARHILHVSRVRVNASKEKTPLDEQTIV